MEMHPLARALNATLDRENPTALAILSARGKGMYFPTRGILGQTADAKGKRYNATIGIALEDDWNPASLPSLAAQFMLAPEDVTPYAPSYGLPELRAMWQQHIRSATPSLKVPCSLPVATAGLTHALSAAGMLFVDPGDRILLPDMYWGNYRLVFENGLGGMLQTFRTFHDGHFDIDALRDALATGPAGKRILLLNFPNNPSGYTPTTEEASRIVAAIRESAEQGSSVVVILDDAYFGFVYEEQILKESLFGMFAGLHENVLAVKIDGASKEDCAWGLRIGFLTFGMRELTQEGLTALEHKTAGIVRATVSSACHASQSALLRAHASPAYQEEKAAIYSRLAERYRAMRDALENPLYGECFRPYPCNSGYFICLQLAEGIDAEAVRQLLLTEYDTGVIAIDSMLRIAFSSLPTPAIPTAMENVFRACLTVRTASSTRQVPPRK